MFSGEKPYEWGIEEMLREILHDRYTSFETFMVFKLNTTADGFTDVKEALEKDTGNARDTRGQLITSLNSMQAAQHRTHGFGVLIAKNTCRLLRHTNSGIRVTQSFNYTETPIET